VRIHAHTAIPRKRSPLAPLAAMAMGLAPRLASQRPGSQDSPKRPLFARAKGLAPRRPRRENPRSHPNSSQKEPSSPSGCYGHGPGAQAGVPTPRLAGLAKEASVRYDLCHRP